MVKSRHMRNFWGAILLSTVFIGDAWAQYKLCAQDVLEITVWQHEDLTRVLTVASEGTITYPLAGTVQAMGLSVGELTGKPGRLAYGIVDRMRKGKDQLSTTSVQQERDAKRCSRREFDSQQTMTGGGS